VLSVGVDREARRRLRSTRAGAIVVGAKDFARSARQMKADGLKLVARDNDESG
jgi:hypothetical protein